MFSSVFDWYPEDAVITHLIGDVVLVQEIDWGMAEACPCVDSLVWHYGETGNVDDLIFMFDVHYDKQLNPTDAERYYEHLIKTGRL